MAGFEVPAGILFFLGTVGLAARLLAKHSADKLEISVGCEPCCIFPDSVISFSYNINNGKLLPLLWLELSQDADNGGCVSPGEEFESYSYHCPGEASGSLRKAYRRSFSGISPLEEVSFTSVWKAIHRGIYSPEKLMLRSGDFFGLACIETPLEIGYMPRITVYPKIVPVDISSLLRFSPGFSHGLFGLSEDLTLIRGTGAYSPGDSWKHLSWRNLARGSEELLVNRFEKLQPYSALFVLDGESFPADSEGSSALEETIEIIASCALGFFEKGCSCGLCLPLSLRSGSICLAPGESCAPELLLSCLAGYAPLHKPEKTEDGVFTGRMLPSEFDTAAFTEAALLSGSIFLFSFCPGAEQRTPFASVEKNRLRSYSYQEAPNCCSTLSLRIGDRTYG